MTFTNSILSGETLVRDAIQSEGFVSGTSGWRIARDGTAEFLDALIRGDIQVNDFLRIVGSDPDAIIEIAISGGNPLFRIVTANGTDYRIVGSSQNALQIGPVSDPNSRTFWVDGEGIVVGRSSLTGAPSVLFDDDTGYLVKGSYFPWVENGWINASLQNGWNTTGVTAFSAPGYREMPDGTVQLRGVMNNGTKTNGTLLFTLPTGLRPPRRKEIGVTTDVAGNNQRVQIFGVSDGATAGQVQIQGLGTGNTIGLDGCRFEVI